WPAADPGDRPGRTEATGQNAGARWLESLEATRRVQPRGLQPAAALASAAADEHRAAIPEARVPSVSSPSGEAVFKRRLLADGKEEKNAFRLQKRNGAEEVHSARKKTDGAEFSAAQVAAAVAAEANQERLLEDELRDPTRPARRFQAQLPKAGHSEKPKSGTGSKAKKPRLIAAADEDDMDDSE
ncbi:unnamed protein product, partial [Durusdinium trenchii]